MTDRQEFLMRFNYINVLDSASDNISLESEPSLFSANSEDKDKSRNI